MSKNSLNYKIYLIIKKPSHFHLNNYNTKLFTKTNKISISGILYFKMFGLQDCKDFQDFNLLTLIFNFLIIHILKVDIRIFMRGY